MTEGANLVLHGRVRVIKIVYQQHIINVSFLINVLSIHLFFPEYQHLRRLHVDYTKLNFMKKISPLVFLLYPVLLLMSGCVTMKQFDELQLQSDQITEDNRRLTLLNQDGEIDRRELTGRVEVLEKAKATLTLDTARLGRSLSEARADIQNLQNLNDVLTSESSSRMAAINDENRALLEELSRNRKELQSQEDDLLRLNTNLELRETELASRSQRIEELEGAPCLEGCCSGGLAFSASRCLAWLRRQRPDCRTTKWQSLCQP